MTKLLLLILSIVAMPILAYSQANELPVHFGQVLNNPMVNPAKGGSLGKLEITLLGKQNTKEYSNVRSSLFSGFFRIGDKGESFHVVGLQFQSAREGDYLRRNRAYISYSRHQRISQNWFLAGGISGGMYVFSIKPNTVTGGASSSSMDSNIGLQLYSGKTLIGFSFNQANEGEVQPFEQKILLQAHINANIRHRLDLSDGLRFTPFAYYRDSENSEFGMQERVGMGGLFLIEQTLNVGASYENEEGIYTFLGLNNLHVGKSLAIADKGRRYDLNLSYFMPFTSNERTNVNSFELNIKYLLQKQSDRGLLPDN